jgi:2-dehydro-3-deoxyphosphogluconate aldolase / (4S)-4-hydroxy-2-oxoglutarate aldolase
MPHRKEEVLRRIEETGVIAVMRAPSKEALGQISEALLAGGLTVIEVTMTTPKAISAIEMLADRFGDRAVVGVGTVLDSATCRDAISAGAQFVVSPSLDREVVETTRKYSRVSIPGAFTPTEILAAWTAGADIVKVFPSTALGPGYFRDILAPLPQLKLTPTGGVDLKNTGEWIRAGAACVGVGSALVSREAIAKQDWAGMTAASKAFLDAVRQARK